MVVKLIFCLGFAIVVFAAGALLDMESGKADLDTKMEDNEAYEEVSLVSNRQNSLAEKHRNFTDVQPDAVVKSDYSSLEAFVRGTAKSWEEHQRHQENEPGKIELAQLTLYYLEYYQKEVRNSGLAKEFDSWKKIAEELCSDQGNASNKTNVDELSNEFQKQMYIIIESL